MRRCVLFDFDGTITTRDTTRYLLTELIRIRPLRLALGGLHLLRVLLSRRGERIQEAKNALIGVMIKGLAQENMDKALSRYAKMVVKLLRPDLMRIIQGHLSEHDLVWIVSASPVFALDRIFHDLEVSILGGRFEIIDGRYTGKRLGPVCYGVHKVEWIKSRCAELTLDIRVVAAWSDSVSDLPMMLLADDRYWVCSDSTVEKFLKIDPTGTSFFAPDLVD